MIYLEWMIRGFLFAVGIAIGILVMPQRKNKSQERLEGLLQEKNDILCAIMDAIRDLNHQGTR